jgi:1-acyl-sn-glycerol-3-phosphate acyltransferase
VLAAALLVWALLPLLLVLALARDLRGASRLRSVRAVLLAALYLACEVYGLAGSLLLWLASGATLAVSRERWLAWNQWLQCTWARALFDGARALYGMAVRVEGEASIERGPLLVFARHASLADTLLGPVLLTQRHGLALRYVLKRELLWEPCIDVVGLRLPNVFVRRSGAASDGDIAALRELARGVFGHAGVLIYPEGTRFTAERRARILADLEARGEHERAVRAGALRHVLPPRIGGVRALLEARPELDVLFCAHVGLEGAARLGDLWRGALIGRELHVRYWRVPATDIPRDPEGCASWLEREWTRLDDWVGSVPLPGAVA